MPKSNTQIEAYGSVDELSSFIGLVSVKASESEREYLSAIQHDLYKIMGCLSGARVVLTSLKKKTTDIERHITRFEKKLPKLNKFILPQGSELAASYHVLRTVCRRAERRVVTYLVDKKKRSKQDDIVVIYLNRLSDLFFTLARVHNREEEILA